MGMLGIWKNALTNPKETFAEEKNKGSWMEGAKNIAVAGVVLGFLFGLVVFMFSALLSVIPGLSVLASFGAAAVIVLPILFAVGLIIIILIEVNIYQFISMVLGGKGKLEQLFYLNSIFSAPILLLTMLLIIIPVLGWLIALLLGIYSLYLMVLALKEVHQFSTGKAIAVVVIKFVVSMLLGFSSVLVR